MSRFLVIAFLLCSGCAETPTSPTTDTPSTKSISSLASTEFSVAHNCVEMSLYRKQMENTKASHNNTLVLLPSATYSTSPNWDLQYNDSSLMDAFAKSGWVVFALDLPGYGNSDNPPGPDTFGAIESSEYIDAAVRFICEKQKIDSVNLLGWSWGAQAAGRFANDFPQRVNKLILYGFTFKNRLPTGVLPNEPFRKLEYNGAMSDFVEGCYEENVPKKYANAALEADHDKLAPTGPIHDFVNRLPIVNPAGLPMPVLVLCGQYELEQPPNIEGNYADHFLKRKRDLESFCQQLPNGNHDLVVVSGGGHAVHLEKPKHEWRKLVLEFLEKQ